MATNDSRYAALKLYRKLRLGWIFNTSTFLGNLIIALGVTYFFRRLGYGDAVDYVFLLAVLSVGLWITEAVPPFAVGILIVTMLLFGLGTDYIIAELSNVMSNTAAASILIPLAITLPSPFGIAVPVMVAISCSCALLLPVSTPSNAIAYATGLIEQKEFRRGGVFFLILGPVSAFLAVMAWVWLYVN